MEASQNHLTEVTKRRQSDLDSNQKKRALSRSSERVNKRRRRGQFEDMETNSLRHHTDLCSSEKAEGDHCHTFPLGESDQDSDMVTNPGYTGNLDHIQIPKTCSLNSNIAGDSESSYLGVCVPLSTTTEISSSSPTVNSNVNPTFASQPDEKGLCGGEEPTQTPRNASNKHNMEQEEMETEIMWKLRANRVKQILSEFGPFRTKFMNVSIDFNVGFGPKQNISVHSFPNLALVEIAKFAVAMNSSQQYFIMEILDYNFDLSFQSKDQRNIFTFEIMETVKQLKDSGNADKHPGEVFDSPHVLMERDQKVESVSSMNPELSSVPPYHFCKEIGLTLHVNQHQENKKLDINKLTNQELTEVANFAEKLCGTFEQICLDIIRHNLDLDLQSGGSDLARSIFARTPFVVERKNLTTCTKAFNFIKRMRKDSLKNVKHDCLNSPNLDACSAGSSQAAAIGQNGGSPPEPKKQKELNSMLWKLRANHIQEMLSTPHEEHCPLYSYSRCKKLGIDFNVGSGVKQNLDPKLLTNGIMVELCVFAIELLLAQRYFITEILEYNFHLNFKSELHRSAFAQEICHKIEAACKIKKQRVIRMNMPFELPYMRWLRESTKYCPKCYQKRQEETDPGHMHQSYQHTMTSEVSADADHTAQKLAQDPSHTIAAEETIMDSYPLCKKVGLNLCVNKDQPKGKLHKKVLTIGIMAEVAQFARELCATKNTIIRAILEHNFNIGPQRLDLDILRLFHRMGEEKTAESTWFSEVFVPQLFSHPNPSHASKLVKAPTVQKSERKETINKRKLALQTKKERATLSSLKTNVAKKPRGNPGTLRSRFPICGMEQEEMGTQSNYTCPLGESDLDSDDNTDSGSSGNEEHLGNSKSCSLSSNIRRESESSCPRIRAPFLINTDMSTSSPSVNSNVDPFASQPDKTQTPRNAPNKCDIKQEETGAQNIMWKLRANRVKQILSEFGPFCWSERVGLEFNVGFGPKQNISVDSFPNYALVEIAKFALAMNSSQQYFIMEILDYNFDLSFQSEDQRNIFTFEIMETVRQLKDSGNADKRPGEVFDSPHVLMERDQEVESVSSMNPELSSVPPYPFCKEIGLTLHVNQHQENKKLDINKLTTEELTEVANFGEKLCGTFEEICLDIIRHNLDLDLQSGGSDLARSIFARTPFVMVRRNLTTWMRVFKKIPRTRKYSPTNVKQDCLNSPNLDACSAGSSQAAAIGQNGGSPPEPKKQKELNSMLWKLRANHIQEMLSTPHEEHCPLYSYSRCKKLGIDFNVGSGVKQNLDPKLLTNGIMVELCIFAIELLSAQRYFITEILEYNFHLEFNNELHRSAFAQETCHKIEAACKIKKQIVPRMNMPFELPDLRCIQESTKYCPKCYQKREEETDPDHMHQSYQHTMTSEVSADADHTAQKLAHDPSHTIAAEETIMDSYPLCKKVGLNLCVNKDQPKDKLDKQVLTFAIMAEVAKFARELCATKNTIIRAILEHNFNIGPQRLDLDISRLFHRMCEEKIGEPTWYSEVFVPQLFSHPNPSHASKLVKAPTVQKSERKETINKRKLALQTKKERATLSSPSALMTNSKTKCHSEVTEKHYPLCMEIGLDLDVTSKSGKKKKLDLKLLTRAVVCEIHKFANKKTRHYMPRTLFEILDYNFDLSSQHHRSWEFSIATSSKILAMVKQRCRNKKKPREVFRLPFVFAPKTHDKKPKKHSRKESDKKRRMGRNHSDSSDDDFLHAVKTHEVAWSYDEDTEFSIDPWSALPMCGSPVSEGCDSPLQGNIQIGEENYDPHYASMNPELDTGTIVSMSGSVDSEACGNPLQGNIQIKEEKYDPHHGNMNPELDTGTIVPMSGSLESEVCGSPLQGNIQIKEEKYDPHYGNMNPELGTGTIVPMSGSLESEACGSPLQGSIQIKEEKYDPHYGNMNPELGTRTIVPMSGSLESEACGSPLQGSIQIKEEKYDPHYGNMNPELGTRTIVPMSGSLESEACGNPLQGNIQIGEERSDPHYVSMNPQLDTGTIVPMCGSPVSEGCDSPLQGNIQIGEDRSDPHYVSMNPQLDTRTIVPMSGNVESEACGNPLQENMQEIETEIMWKLRANRVNQILSSPITEFGQFTRSKKAGLEFNVGFSPKQHISVDSLSNPVLLEVAKFALAMNSSQQDFIMEILEYNFDFGLQSQHQRDLFMCEIMNRVRKLRSCEDAVKFSKEVFQLPGSLSSINVKNQSMGSVNIELNGESRMAECGIAPRCPHSNDETIEHISEMVGVRYPFCNEIGLKLHVNQCQPNTKLDITKLTNGAMTEVTNFVERLSGTFEQIFLDILRHNLDLDLQSGDSDLVRDLIARIPTVVEQKNLSNCFNAEVYKQVKESKNRHSEKAKLDCQDDQNLDECSASSSQVAIIYQNVGNSLDIEQQKQLHLKLWKLRANHIEHILSVPHGEHCPLYSYPRCKKSGIDFNVGFGVKQNLDPKLLTNGIMVELNTFATALLSAKKYFITEILEYNFHLEFKSELHRSAFAQKTEQKIRSTGKRKKTITQMKQFELPDTRCLPDLHYYRTTYCPKCYQDRNQRLYQDKSDPGHIGHPHPHTMLHTVSAGENCTEQQPPEDLYTVFSTLGRSVMADYPLCKKIGLNLFVDKDQPKDKLDTHLLTYGAMNEVANFAKIMCGTKKQIINDILEHNFDINMQGRAFYLSRMLRSIASDDGEEAWFNEVFVIPTFSPICGMEQEEMGTESNYTCPLGESDLDSDDITDSGSSGNQEHLRNSKSCSLSSNILRDSESSCPRTRAPFLINTDMSTSSPSVNSNVDPFASQPDKTQAPRNAPNKCDIKQEEMETEIMWKLRANRVKQILSELGPLRWSEKDGLEYNVGFGPKQNISVHSFPNRALVEIAKFAVAMNSSQQYFIMEILDYNFDLSFQSEDQRNIFTFKIMETVRQLKDSGNADKHPGEVFDSPHVFMEWDQEVESVSSMNPELSSVSRREVCNVAPTRYPQSHAETKECMSLTILDPYPFCKEMGLTLHVNQHQENKKLDINKLTNQELTEVANFAEKLCGTFEQICLDIIRHNLDLDLQSGGSDLARSIFARTPFVVERKNLTTWIKTFKRIQRTRKYNSINVKQDCLNSPNLDACSAGSSQAAAIGQNGGSPLEPKKQKELNSMLWKLRANHIQEILSTPHEEHCPLYSYSRCRKLGIDFNVGSGVKQNLDPKLLTNGIMVELCIFAIELLSAQRHFITEILEYNFHLEFNSELHRSAFAQHYKFVEALKHKKQIVPRMNMPFELPDLRCIQESTTYCPKCYQKRQEETDPGHMYQSYQHTMTSEVSADADHTAQKLAHDPSHTIAAEETIMDSYPLCKKVGLNLCVNKDQPKDKLDKQVLTIGIMAEVAQFARELCATKNTIIRAVLEHNFNIGPQRLDLDILRLFHRMCEEKVGEPTWFSEVFVPQLFSHPYPSHASKLVKAPTAQKSELVSASKLVKAPTMQKSERKETINKRKLALQTKKERATLSSPSALMTNSKTKCHSEVTEKHYPLCMEIGLDLDVTSKSGKKEKLDLNLLTRAVVCEIHKFANKKTRHYMPRTLFEILDYNFDLSSQHHRSWEFSIATSSKILAMVKQRCRNKYRPHEVFKLPFVFAPKTHDKKPKKHSRKESDKRRIGRNHSDSSDVDFLHGVETHEVAWSYDEDTEFSIDPWSALPMCGSPVSEGCDSPLQGNIQIGEENYNPHYASMNPELDTGTIVSMSGSLESEACGNPLQGNIQIKEEKYDPHYGNMNPELDTGTIVQMSGSLESEACGSPLQGNIQIKEENYDPHNGNMKPEPDTEENYCSQYDDVKTEPDTEGAEHSVPGEPTEPLGYSPMILWPNSERPPAETENRHVQCYILTDTQGSVECPNSASNIKIELNTEGVQYLVPVQAAGSQEHSMVLGTLIIEEQENVLAELQHC